MGTEPVGVIGGGLMGHGIAQVFATAGHPVTVVDSNPNVFAAARAKIGRNLDLLVEYGLLGPELAARVPDRIQFTTDLAAVGSCLLVIESVFEDADLKNELFRELAPLLGPETILTTNTSSIPLKVLAAATGRPDRFATSHFFRPAYIVPMVEVTKGEQTSEDTVETVIRLLRGAGLRPVRINVDVPGQVANRLRHALLREGMDLVERGVISAEDLDELVAFSFGPRMPLMGVIRDRDLVGLDITLEGSDRVWPDLCTAERPHRRLRDLVEAGNLGLKTGGGLYDWSGVDFADYWEALERRQIEIFQTLRRTGVLAG